MDAGHHIHGLTPTQVVALIHERDDLAEMVAAQQRLLRPNIVLPAAWRLTPGESATLIAIRAASPGPVSRDRIFAAVYGLMHDDPPDEKVVFTRVCRIRRKLGAAQTGVVIETVWGVGFRMDPDNAERFDRAIAAARRLG